MSESVARAEAGRAPASAIKGIAWMGVTGLMFVGVTGVVRYLGSDMNPAQAAFIRYLFGTLMLTPVFFRLRLHAGMTRRIGLYALRGVVHGVAVILWFFAMARIPIAEVTALGFTAPIFTTVGAALFLGEKLHMRRVGAVVAGFGGAIVILRPGLEVVHIGAVAQLVSAPLMAVSFLLAKKLTETESPTEIIAFMAVFVTLALAPPAILAWRTPTPAELMWLFMAAVFATLGHYAMTQAFRAADITVTQPFSFLQLVWATLLGFYMFGETPDGWTLAGGGIIVASATYIAHREARRKGRADIKPAQGV
jgi:drug/metabolite transporter (DMT)-like permease